MTTNLVEALRLMLVTDDRWLDTRGDAGGSALVDACRAAERGGVTSVQLRLKAVPARALAELARALMAALRVPVLLDDRPDVALAVGAAGAHLGADDLPLALARRIAPAGFILGGSVGSEAEAAQSAEADYWGIGPWRATATKADAGEALGEEGFRRLVALAGGRPCVAIGAVRPDDVPRVRAAGGAGVAVVSGILGADDVESAARAYRAAEG
jgi:thiamine-phosphate pyrophosphorylase